MKSSLFILIMAMMPVAVLAGQVHIEDGQNHNIDDARYFEDTLFLDRYISNTPGTSLQLKDGAYLGSFIYAYNNSSIIMDGGSILGGLWGFDNSSLEFNGGIANEGVAVFHNSTAIITGGTIEDSTYAGDNARIDIYGGTTSTIYVSKSAVINVYGGEIKESFRSYENGTIYLYGSDFQVTAGGITTDLTYGDRLSDYGILNDEYDYLTGQITGTLNDSTIFNTQFDIHGVSDIIIVPEPASLALLLLGGGAALRRRGANRLGGRRNQKLRLQK
jgi:hypothetical protein